MGSRRLNFKWRVTRPSKAFSPTHFDRPRHDFDFARRRSPAPAAIRCGTALLMFWSWSSQAAVDV